MIGSISSGTSSSYLEQMQSNLFKALDKNSDSKLDTSEVTQALTGSTESNDSASSLLSGLDTDEDGAISELEFEAALSKLSREMSSEKSEKDSELFSRIDTDGDGSVTEEEFVSNRPEDMTEDQAAQMWANLDTESAGSLSESEFTTAMASQAPPQGPPPGPPPSQSATESEDESLTSLASSTDTTEATSLFGKIDTNGDGSVTEEEYLAARPDDVTEEMAAQMWSTLDAEGAGSITESQFNTAMASQAPPQGPPPGPPPSQSATGENDTDSAAVLSSLTTDDTTSSTTEAEDTTGYDLKSLLSAAMESYLKNSSGFFAQNTAASTFMSSYA